MSSNDGCNESDWSLYMEIEQSERFESTILRNVLVPMLAAWTARCCQLAGSLSKDATAAEVEVRSISVLHGPSQDCHALDASPRTRNELLAI